MSENRDVQILRSLVQEYLDLCRKPVYDERRQLWREHNSLRPTRPLVIIHYGMWNVWCRDFFGEQTLQCQDPLFRNHERTLRMSIWHDSVGDDWILEPWISHRAAVKHGGSWTGVWGVENAELERSSDEGSFRNVKPPLQTWDDMAKMRAPVHEVDEAATAEAVSKLQDAVGDLIEIDVNRGPLLQGFMADISTSLAYLRGLQQLMVDMYESPTQLKELLAFMRDGILMNQQQAEEAGDFSLSNHANQAMPYSLELEDQQANSGPRRRKELWGFFAAQEYTLISPKFHDEFLYQYQLPIMSHFGLTHYGCCEDLTKKIDMLRQAPNLRSIAVTPVADVVASAEQIGTDYVFSWRPNPTDMVAHSWDEGRVRRIIGEGLRATQGCHVHVHLKDIETVGGDPGRLAQWVAVVKDEIEKLP